MIKPVRAGFRNILLDTCADLGEGVGPPPPLFGKLKLIKFTN